MLSLGFAACSSKPEVILYAPAGLPSAGVHFAEARGRFGAQGIRPRWSKARTEIEAIEHLAQGKLEAAILPIVPQLLFKGGLASHSSLVAEAGHFTAPVSGAKGNLALMVSRELAGKSRPDGDGRIDWLRGRSLAIGKKRGSPEALALARLLERSGMSRLDLREVYMKAAEVRRGFKLETLDAALVSEPHATLIEKDGTAVRWLEADALVAPILNSGLFLSRKFMREAPQRAGALVRAYVEGVAEFGRATDFSPLQEGLALPDATWWKEAARIVFERGAAVDEARLRATLAAFLEDRGPRSLSLENFWDPGFLAQALASRESR